MQRPISRDFIGSRSRARVLHSGRTCRHADGPQLQVERVVEALRGPFSDPKIPKVGHNLKYDYVMLRRYGLNAAPLGFDSMIAEWLTDPASRNLGLKNLAWVRQGIGMTNIEELIGKGRNQISMDQVADASRLRNTPAMDVRVVLMLKPELEGGDGAKAGDAAV